MASNSDWVADVRRWYFGRSPAGSSDPAARAKDAPDSAFGALGYEAANPSLQSIDWPDAAGNGEEGPQ